MSVRRDADMSSEAVGKAINTERPFSPEARIIARFVVWQFLTNSGGTQKVREPKRHVTQPLGSDSCGIGQTGTGFTSVNPCLAAQKRQRR